MGNRPADRTCDWLNWEGHSGLKSRGGQRLGGLLKMGIELPGWMEMRHRSVATERLNSWPEGLKSQRRATPFPVAVISSPKFYSEK